MRQYLTLAAFLVGTAALVGTEMHEPDEDVRKWPRIIYSGVTVPDDVSEGTIRDWVLSLAGPGRKNTTVDKLLLVGQKAKVPLVEALNRAEFLKQEDSPNRDTFDELCLLLEQIVPPEAIPSLLGIAAGPYKPHARQAVHLLGCIAQDACLPAIIKALRDDDDYTRGFALMGLHTAISRKRGSKEFWTGLYPNLIPLIDRQDSSILGLAPLLIVAIEPEAGTRLLREKYCTRSNRQLTDTLAALRESRIAVPKPELDRLISDLSHDNTDFPWALALGELLRLLASNDHPQARTLSLRYLDHDDEWIRRGAADALFQINGMEDPLHVISRLWEAKGYDSLTEPQRTVNCVMSLVNQEHEGGLGEFLDNPGAEDLDASLVRIGAPKLAKSAAATYLKAFGASGLAKDLERRAEQMRHLGEEQRAALVAFDAEYTAGPERIETLAVKYALQHPEDFRPIPSSGNK